MLFLIAVEIIDGEHEHRDWGIVRAENMGEAEKIVEDQLDKDNDENDISDEARYWTYGDGLTAVKLHAINPLTPNDAKVLQKLGIAYIINEEAR